MSPSSLDQSTEFRLVRRSRVGTPLERKEAVPVEPSNRFKNQTHVFWANVRTVSQQNGYTRRNTEGARQIRVPTLTELRNAYRDLGLTWDHVLEGNELTEFGSELIAYFEYRSDVLFNKVRPALMNAEQAEALFYEMKNRLDPKCPLPMNKQKGEKKKPAYLTGLVNMMVESAIGDRRCDYDPRALTTVTANGVPLRTLTRRVDGAFPATVNPVAIWEIKEYYHTTTFGSRVSGGVYETMLDGMELEELADHEQIDVKHYLIVDAFRTWWKDGRSYLCRMIDMMHMGYADEVIFGNEVVDRIPPLAEGWIATLDARAEDGPPARRLV